MYEMEKCTKTIYNCAPFQINCPYDIIFYLLRVNKYNKVQTDETNMRRIAIYLLCIFMLLPVATMTAQPGYNYSKLQREKLNRGVVAIRENPSEVIVSWRYLSSDPIQTGFNVYRDGKKLTDTPI